MLSKHEQYATLLLSRAGDITKSDVRSSGPVTYSVEDNPSTQRPRRGVLLTFPIYHRLPTRLIKATKSVIVPIQQVSAIAFAGKYHFLRRPAVLVLLIIFMKIIFYFFLFFKRNHATDRNRVRVSAVAGEPRGGTRDRRKPRRGLRRLDRNRHGPQERRGASAEGFGHGVDICGFRQVDDQPEWSYQ